MIFDDEPLTLATLAATPLTRLSDENAQMTNSVTNLLNAMANGQGAQDDRLLAQVYQELRIVARSRLRQKNTGELDTTGLVHEAYLRLVGGEQARDWDNRHHFYATAALAMRQLLVDQARRQLTEKRGGGQMAVTLDEQVPGLQPEVVDVVALDVALEQLQRLEPELAKLVELRFFLGLSVDEVSKLNDVPKRTLARNWQKAKAFLHVQLASC